MRAGGTLLARMGAWSSMAELLLLGLGPISANERLPRVVEAAETYRGRPTSTTPERVL